VKQEIVKKLKKYLVVCFVIVMYHDEGCCMVAETFGSLYSIAVDVSEKYNNMDRIPNKSLQRTGSSFCSLV